MPAKTHPILRVLVTITLILLPLPIFIHAGSNEKSKAFLEQNSKSADVISLPSGLQYKVLRKGSGRHHPTIDSPCECHYKGTLIDGTQFDSSYDRGEPTTFAPNQVIKGWTEAMQLMVEGDKWEMYIPSELGYGDGGSPPKIGGGDALIFTMEILKIKGDKVPAMVCDVISLDGCEDREKEYVEKIRKKFGGDADFMEEELERVRRVSVNNVNLSDKLRDWGRRRAFMLEKLLSEARGDEL